MKRYLIAMVAVIGVLSLMVGLFGTNAEAKKPGRGQLYYEDGLVDVLIPTQGDGSDVNFKGLPENAKAYPFDPIYVFVDENTGMPHAQPPVIGSVPGDKEYTGGRWQVFLVYGTVEADDDLTSIGELMSSGLTIEETQMYFVCPVIGK
jgi:hypothetical protein